jgi:hypothetical protein
MSTLFKLNGADLAKGVVVAALTAFLTAIVQALAGHGLDVASYDWAFIAKVTVMATGGYLSKNLFTTEDGKVLGFIG